MEADDERRGGIAEADERRAEERERGEVVGAVVEPPRLADDGVLVGRVDDGEVEAERGVDALEELSALLLEGGAEDLVARGERVERAREGRRIHAARDQEGRA